MRPADAIRSVRGAVTAHAWSRPAVAVLVVGTCASIVALTWFGVHALNEWRRSSAQLIDRVTDDRADLLATALSRDMRGAQVEVLASRDGGDYATEPLADFVDHIAAAFARYPYPESFFAWRSGDADVLLFFNRADRQPPWSTSPDGISRYPVVVERNSAVANRLRLSMRPFTQDGRAYAIFDETVDGVTYQVITRLQYADAGRQVLVSVSGFMVNLPWVREHYFSEIAAQVARIGAPAVRLDYAVVDSGHHTVAGTGTVGAAAERQFQLQFFDPRIAAGALATGDPWRLQVSAARDPSAIWATRQADWTMVAVGTITVALALSVMMVAYAARANASMAEMRSDFVATVTHELKTPLAAIRAIADTLMRGALSPEGVREYAVLLAKEGRRLTRLLDNLLVYSRISDVTEAYAFEPVDAAALVEECVDRFRRQLVDKQFSIEVDTATELPPVRGDRTALQFALDNLIDNAIRYSGDGHWIRVAARRDGADVAFEVCDHGIGVAMAHLAAVQRRFVRGPGSRGTSGTGLGLAIVRRIAGDHAGRFDFSSEPGVGTTARFTIPIHHG